MAIRSSREIAVAPATYRLADDRGVSLVNGETQTIAGRTATISIDPRNARRDTFRVAVDRGDGLPWNRTRALQGTTRPLN